MKKIARYSSKVEAHLVHEALLHQGIKSEISGSREYASIITGSDFGRFDLLVDDDHVDDAQKILTGMELQTKPIIEDPSLNTAGKLFRKSLFMGILAALILPLVFNIVSIKLWIQYLKAETSLVKKILASLILGPLQIVGIIAIFYLFSSMDTLMETFWNSFYVE